MRRVKIIATYGPSLDDDKLKSIVTKVDCIRVNLSHVKDIDELKLISDRIDDARDRYNLYLAKMADLPGVKIRLGDIKDINIRKGDIISFSNKKVEGAVPVDYDNLFEDISEESIVVIGDGELSFEVVEKGSNVIKAKALNDGILKARRGFSIKNGKLSAKVPTREDIELFKAVRKLNFDYVAESFVSSALDIRKLRDIDKDINIIAKVETLEGLNNIDNIIDEADGLMIARGDLAITVSLEKIPYIQKFLVKKARAARKLVIVATQLMSSMVSNTKPTRAEVNDVANAVYEGVDAVMLSEETAIGRYPIETVEQLNRIIEENQLFGVDELPLPTESPYDMIASAAASIVNSKFVEHIVSLTSTGATAKRVSAIRPNADIIAVTLSRKVARMLSLYYGVIPKLIDEDPSRYKDNISKLIEAARSRLKELNINRYVLLYGKPNVAGSTNTLTLEA
ncbi:MAG: pyruvate kinase [Candidatus Micrarchaeota archaeon]|nr:MAG: pyruvate kinase [Candidatus Micrarchaeota archaeon]